MMRLRSGSWTLLFWAVVATLPAACGGEPAPLPSTTPWDVPRLQNTVPTCTWIQQEGPIRSLMYGGEPYQGHPTRVFAYYASPATLGSSTFQAPYPGIVLVHGGGGKAFADWAKIWAEHGYAAIAMDLAGCGADEQPLPDGGPGQGDDTKFGAIDAPASDQWSYHAVADVILAHSLLCSFQDVDKDRTAVTGISWGGYLTCIVAGLDQRSKLAMPVYGCGFLEQNSAWVVPQFEKMTPERRDKWTRLWDPSRYIGSATMPVVFLNGTNDFAYPMDSYAKTCRLVQSPKHYSIQLKMPHGHIFDFPEFFLFVDQYLKGGTSLPVIATPTVADGRVTAAVTTSSPLAAARLHYTTGPHKDNPTREWTTQPLEIDGHTISGPAPPADATAWYVDVSDDRRARTSSEPIVRCP